VFWVVGCVDGTTFGAVRAIDGRFGAGTKGNFVLVVAAYHSNLMVLPISLSETIYAAFSVSDISQNGLSELMLVVQSRAKAPWNEFLAVQLLEFPNAKPVSLGSFFIGGPPRLDTDGPRFITCLPKAPKELQKTFPSNIIYVQKGKVPQFFAEGWEVNCDYLEKGVKAKKISSLTPIKPVPRAVPLTRLF
jgi:hypothetical protein